MNRKTIIQIIVIVLAFGGSGIVLYRGLFSKPAPPPVSAGFGPIGGPVGGIEPGEGQITLEKILPHGDGLDLNKVLYGKGFRYNEYGYPVLSTSSEVGIREEMLIQPPPNAVNE